MDIVDKETRSRMMSAVRSKNTSAEVNIRRRVFRLGFRYRLNGPGLPGKPDLIFPKYRAVIFVNGCFWHNHHCRFGTLPTTRREWWRQKLEGNRQRDAVILTTLKRMGWRALTVWECSFRKANGDRSAALNNIAVKIARFLCSHKKNAVISGTISDVTSESMTDR